MGREYTQRTRSFLFAALATVIARLLGLWRIRFYENGIISFNLPISEQLIGARASRTTHPRTLKLFSKLFGALFQHPFAVENPYVWKTKAEVVEVISKAGCGGLIKYSTSCAHTWDMTTIHTHCGKCSQCIDRRFGILASGNSYNEPAEMYKVELFKAPREEGTDRTIAESYVRTATEIKAMTDGQFFSKFQELNRILPDLNGKIIDSANKVWNLYERHAKQVCDVVDAGIKTYASELREGSLPESCLVAMAATGKYRQSAKYN